MNQAVVALKSNKYAHATSIAGLKGAKLGTQLGTTSYGFITERDQAVGPSPAPTTR